jgi:hypothetical protein
MFNLVDSNSNIIIHDRQRHSITGTMDQMGIDIKQSKI